jgi:hypothetical protein
MNPKFSVGEVVILQSVNRPDLNGEYSVLIVVNEKMAYECPITGKKIINGGDCVGYVLDDGALDETDTCCQWKESALRKKHQPGEQSFTDLMASLKNPVSV